MAAVAAAAVVVGIACHDEPTLIHRTATTQLRVPNKT